MRARAREIIVPFGARNPKSDFVETNGGVSFAAHDAKVTYLTEHDAIKHAHTHTHTHESSFTRLCLG